MDPSTQTTTISSVNLSLSQFATCHEKILYSPAPGALHQTAEIQTCFARLAHPPLSAHDVVGSTTHADASTANAWEYVVHPARSQLASRLLGLVGLLQSSTSISQANSRHRRSRPPCAVTRNTPLVLGCNSCLDTPSSSWIPIFYFLR